MNVIERAQRIIDDLTSPGVVDFSDDYIIETRREAVSLFRDYRDNDVVFRAWCLAMTEARHRHLTGACR